MPDVFFEGEIDGIWHEGPVELKGLSIEELCERLYNSPDWYLKSWAPPGFVREKMFSEITIKVNMDFPEQEQE